MTGKFVVCMAVAGALLLASSIAEACDNGKKSFDLGNGKKMHVTYDDKQCKKAAKATKEDNVELVAVEDVSKVKVQVTLQKVSVGNGKIADIVLRDKHANYVFEEDQVYEGDFNPTCRCVSTGGRLFVYCW